MVRVRLRASAGLFLFTRVCVGPLAAALTAAGCVAGSEAARMETRSALEAGGVPARVDPPADMRELPEHRRGPFGAGYGSAPAALLARGAAPAPSLDAEAVIAAAITAHEMRNP
jgi:hypothetical protein